MDYSQLTVVGMQAALSAGEVLRRGFGTIYEITSKPGVQNFVTEFDFAAEKRIIDTIKSHFPKHGFLAEESGQTPASDATEEIQWIIDPLDGTLNFSHHIPIFCVSIAAAKGKDILSGIIYQPITQELFVAQKGLGTYLNGVRMQVSQTKNFHNALGSTGFYNHVLKDTNKSTDSLIKIFKQGSHLRDLGSTAISLAYVASGRLDAYWGTWVNAWDIAAGKLLIEEAGGKLSHIDGSEHQLFVKSNVLGTNGLCHSELVNLLK